MGFRISKCLPRIIRSKTQKLTLADHLHEIAQKHPDRQAIIQSETGEIWTFKKLDEYANQVCHHFMSEFDAGDTVALIRVRYYKNIFMVKVIFSCLTHHFPH